MSSNALGDRDEICMNLIDKLLLEATPKKVRTLVCAMQRALQVDQDGKDRQADQHVRECNQAYIEYYKESNDTWVQNDFSATKLATLLDYTALGAASQERRDCRKTVEFAVKCDWRALRYVSIRLINDLNILKLCSSGLALQFASLGLRQSIEAAMWAVTKDGLAYFYVKEPASRNEDVIWAAARRDASVVQFIECRFPRGLALYAVSQDGMLVRFADCKTDDVYSLWNARGSAVLREAVRQNPEAIRYASTNFGKDAAGHIPPEQALVVVSSNGLLLEFLGEAYQRNQEVVKAALVNNGLALEHACTSFKRQKMLVLEAVRQNGLAIRHVDDLLFDDRDVVLEAVRQNGLALKWAHTSLQADPSIVDQAIRQNGLALKWAHPSLQADPSIVDQAIQQNALALEHASPDLRKSDLAKKACKLNARALQFADALRNDDLVVMECVLRDGSCLAFASFRIRSRPEFIHYAQKTCGNAFTFASWCGKLNYWMRSMID
jgi:hypothetical protein